MSYTQILIHYVFRTKRSARYLQKPHFERMQKIISGICMNLGVRLHAYGGIQDHIHLLLEQPAHLAVSEIAAKLKANSSRAMNKNQLPGRRFSWSRRYGAFSVSPGNVKQVRMYIQNQEEHHRKLTSAEEFQLFLQKCGLKSIREMRHGEDD